MMWALEHFGLNVSGKTCCDLGSHIGGFVDALLQSGAARVYSVDTCYGTLAWKLRNDPRVVVLERTNALHVSLGEKVDLVTSDVGWTRQEMILPRAVSLLGKGGFLLSLVKPQYEAEKDELVRGTGRVSDEALGEIIARVRRVAVDLGLPIRGPDVTPFVGGKGKNPEFFLLLGPFH